MSDVQRYTRELQEVIYTVGPEIVRSAISAWLYDHHNGVFTPETTMEFHEDGSVTVTTPFVRELTA